MAYARRARSSYGRSRSAPRTYRSRSTGRRRSSGRRVASRGRAATQTIVLRVEGVAASQVSRPSLNPVPGVPVTGPKRAKL